MESQSSVCGMIFTEMIMETNSQNSYDFFFFISSFGKPKNYCCAMKT